MSATVDSVLKNKTVMIAIGCVAAGSLAVGAVATAALSQSAQRSADAESTIGTPPADSTVVSTTQPHEELGQSGGNTIVVSPEEVGDGDNSPQVPSEEAGDDNESIPGPEGIVTPVDPVAEPDVPGEDAGQGVELDPVSPGDSSSQPTLCEIALADGQRFAVPSDIQLDADKWNGSLHIENCVGEPFDIDVVATNKVTVGFADLELGVNGAELVFDIDAGSFETGAAELQIKVTDPECCADRVHIHGFKRGFNTDYFDPDLGLTAGGGAGGCKAGCITKAWLTPYLFSVGADLEITTNVDADIKVFISTVAPTENGSGIPVFAGASPYDSANNTTSMQTKVEGFEADQLYYIVVHATDDNGTSYVSEQFTLADALENPTGFDGNDPNPGCSAGCITSASIKATAFDRAELTVASSMPATFDVFIGTQPIDDSGKDPQLPGATVHDTAGQLAISWGHTIESLNGDTTYSVLLRATDENGKQDFQTGTFTTLAKPKTRVAVSFDRVMVTYDADPVWWDHGELRFDWRYDGQTLGERSEERMQDPSSFYLDEHNEVVLYLGDDDRTGRLDMWAGERDVSIVGFCEVPEPGLECHGITWNKASTPQVNLADIAAMPLCEEYGFEGHKADDRCLTVSAPGNHGYRTPRFSTIVRFDMD